VDQQGIDLLAKTSTAIFKMNTHCIKGIAELVLQGFAT